MGDTEGWVTLVRPLPRIRLGEQVSVRRLLLSAAAGLVVILALLGLLASLVTGTLAERQSLADGRRTADLLAEIALEPHLNAAALAGDPAALSAVDQAVRRATPRLGVQRVKVFDATGRVVYSDEPLLIGRRFELGSQERAALTSSTTTAARSAAAGAENEFEVLHGDFLEARRSVIAGDGQRLLFEVYLSYAVVTERASQMWRSAMVLVGLSLASAGLLIVPVAQRLVRSLQGAHTQQAELLQQAGTATIEERRRIAATLHDGPVQDLAAAHLAVAGVATRLDRIGEQALSAQVRAADLTVRQAIDSLRSLLIEVYPPNLESIGLEQALRGLASSLAQRGTVVVVQVEPGADSSLSTSQRQLVFRFAQEALRNAAAHAGADTVTLTLSSQARDHTLLEVRDDGRGFALSETLESPDRGHIGISTLLDAARSARGQLSVRTAPNEGTAYRLVLPHEPDEEPGPAPGRADR